MKALVRLIAWSAGVMVLGVALLAALFWSQRTVWPAFPQSSEKKPQVVAVVERDFAWRTADHVPVTIFIKQKKGVTIDPNSLAVEGDFEIVGNPEIYMRDTRSGDTYYRIRLVLQSFVIAPRLTLAANMAYTVDGDPDPKLITLPAIEIHTSPTWDGRQPRQDGPMTVVQGWHPWTTALMLLVGLAGAVASFLAYRKVARLAQAAAAAPLTGRALARRDFEQVWQTILDGRDTQADYKQIERIIRRLYHIETRVTWEIPLEIGEGHPHLKQILGIHQLCDRVLYKVAELNAAEKAEIRKLWDEMTVVKKSVPVADSK